MSRLSPTVPIGPVDSRAPRARRAPVSGLAILVAALVAVGASGLSVRPVVAAAESPVMRATRLAGPVDVRGGDHLATVAQISLGAGNWTVLAKGVLRNTTTSTTAHPVRCRLAFGGTNDQVLASPNRRGPGGSTQALLLTHAAHLTAATTARLRCGAPGSSTGAVVIEDMRLVAMRTAALFVREMGHSAPFFGDPEAAIQVRQIIADGQLVGDTPTVVATLPLPAGRWAITAKATVQQGSEAGGAAATCDLTPGPDFHMAVAAVDRAGRPADRAPIELEALAERGSTFDADLRCRLSDGAGPVWIRDIRVTAYRLTAFARHALDPGYTFGMFPATIKPVVYAGYNDFDAWITAGDDLHTMASMTLPAGRYMVVTMGVMGQTGTVGSSVSCRLGRGDHQDTLDVRLAAHDATHQRQPFVMIWTGSFAGVRTARFACRSSDGYVELTYIRMFVYKAGTLTTGA